MASAGRTAKQAPPKSTVGLTLILGALTAFGPLSVDMYLPAFPRIGKDFGVPVGAVGFTLSAYLFGSALGQVIYGPLADRFGRRRPLIIGCCVFAGGALGCALAPSLGVLGLARVIQALGGAAGMVITRAVVRDLFHERDAARMFSQLMLVMGISPILAPWLGGQILAVGTWRMLFFLLVGFGVLGAVISAVWLPETLPVEKRTRGGLPATVRSFWGLLRERHFQGYALVAGLGSGSLFGYITGSPVIFMEIHHVSEQRFGLFFGVNAAGFIGAAQLNRWLLRKYSPATILSGATFAGVCAGITLVICAATGWGGLPALAILLFASLAALGLAGPNVAAAALAPYGHAAGSASGLLGMTQFLVGGLAGGAVGFFHNGTALPLALTVATTWAGSFIALRTLARARPNRI